MPYLKLFSESISILGPIRRGQQHPHFSKNPPIRAYKSVMTLTPRCLLNEKAATFQQRILRPDSV